MVWTSLIVSDIQQTSTGTPPIFMIHPIVWRILRRLASQITNRLFKMTSATGTNQSHICKQTRSTVLNDDLLDQSQRCSLFSVESEGQSECTSVEGGSSALGFYQMLKLKLACTLFTK